MVPQSSSRDKLVQAEFPELTFTVRSRSMEPAIREGDRLLVKRSRWYWPGDVVVLPGADCLIAHRLLGWRRKDGHWRAVTAGDANAHLDATVASGSIVGRVVARTGAEQALRVPPVERLRALGRFARFAAGALRRRLG
jgi:signal peptidase I